LIYIASLFSLITVHGVFLDTFKTGTITPIPKRRNVNGSDRATYGSIALSSIFGKILDNVILLRYPDKLIISDLQSGFTTKHSTNHCTMISKETIAYNVRNQSSVFCMFLDASKAFDRVQYGKLFQLLFKCKLPVVIVRVLVKLYMGNFVRVGWCGMCF
jgi:Reverse transcriptase (RNA-dependent DNA polymerase)